jgi:hypothetical protein
MEKIRICSCGKNMTDDQMVLFAMFKVCVHDEEETKEEEENVK